MEAVTPAPGTVGEFVTIKDSSKSPDKTSVKQDKFYVIDPYLQPELTDPLVEIMKWLSYGEIMEISKVKEACAIISSDPRFWQIKAQDVKEIGTNEDDLKYSALTAKPEMFQGLVDAGYTDLITVKLFDQVYKMCDLRVTDCESYAVVFGIIIRIKSQYLNIEYIAKSMKLFNRPKLVIESVLQVLFSNGSNKTYEIVGRLWGTIDSREYKFHRHLSENSGLILDLLYQRETKEKGIIPKFEEIEDFKVIRTKWNYYNLVAIFSNAVMNNVDYSPCIGVDIIRKGVIGLIMDGNRHLILMRKPQILSNLLKNSEIKNAIDKATHISRKHNPISRNLLLDVKSYRKENEERLNRRAKKQAPRRQNVGEIFETDPAYQLVVKYITDPGVYVTSDQIIATGRFKITWDTEVESRSIYLNPSTMRLLEGGKASISTSKINPTVAEYLYDLIAEPILNLRVFRV